MNSSSVERKKTTVLIVDDSALIRELFRDMLSAEPDIVVLDTASDPLDAREKIKRLNPDVLTLDIEMPKMDGLSFLEKIMTLRPMPVIMASTLTQRGAEATIRALEIGAFDYISKPVESQTQDNIALLRDELVEKVRAAGRVPRILRRVAVDESVLSCPPWDAKTGKIIAIGASTGGVEALRDVFVRLPANCPPIAVTQHMPPHFTRSFAERLDTLSQVRVVEAEHHMRLAPGLAVLAPGDRHLRIVKLGGEFVCRLEDGPLVSSHKPSVDVLFESVAEAAGARAVGVIMTGMGKDGAKGLLKMRQAGARTLGQDAPSCVVYGMPRVAKDIGGVEGEAPLREIAERMLALCGKG